MAQPTNLYDTYDMVGIFEDLEDKIYDISPGDTPGLSAFGTATATQSLHEWQTDAVRSSAANAHIEGDDSVPVARAATTRLGNRTQIFKDVIAISDGEMGVKKAGRSKEMVYQTAKAMKAMKLDIERALFDNNAAVAGNSTTARELAGIPAWLATNTVFENGNSGADPTGDGTDARTDDGTPVAFSQARLNTCLQSIWESGGKADKVFLSAFQMNAALGFVGSNNQRSTVTVTDGKQKVSNDIAVYATPWGTIEFCLSREHRARDVLALDTDMWAVAHRRKMNSKELAKTGDSTKRQILAELTLVAKNEASSGAVYDNTTS